MASTRERLAGQQRQQFCEIAVISEDTEVALDAAHAAGPAKGTSSAEPSASTSTRSLTYREQTEMLARARLRDGRYYRERTMAADSSRRRRPLRYCRRDLAQEGYLVADG